MTLQLTSHWAGTEPAALIPQMDRIVISVRDSTLARLRRGAEAAYAGTRFAHTFVVQGDTLFSTDPLFIVVEAPTRPHRIDAKAGPYLWFKGNRGWVKVAHVDHPGTAGKRFLTVLWDVFGADVGAQLGQGWEGLQRDLP